MLPELLDNLYIYIDIRSGASSGSPSRRNSRRNSAQQLHTKPHLRPPSNGVRTNFINTAINCHKCFHLQAATKSFKLFLSWKSVNISAAFIKTVSHNSLSGNSAVMTTGNVSYRHFANVARKCSSNFPMPSNVGQCRVIFFRQVSFLKNEHNSRMPVNRMGQCVMQYAACFMRLPKNCPILKLLMHFS